MALNAQELLLLGGDRLLGVDLLVAWNLLLVVAVNLLVVAAGDPKVAAVLSVEGSIVLVPTPLR